MSVYKKQHIIAKEDINGLKQKCSRMSDLIDFVGDVQSFYIPDYFTSLVNGIIYQSISYKAATSIWNRFMILLPNITPNDILSKSHEEIKSVGLSKSKAEYILNIANAFKNKTIRTDFEMMDNNLIHKELQKIKGLGPWTSEMFLIFCLYRKDVLSYGDIAIRRGIEWLYQLDNELTKKEFLFYEKKYSPYKTLASFYLWEITLRKIRKTHNRDFTLMV